MFHHTAVDGSHVFFMSFSICQLEIPSSASFKYFALNFILYDVNIARIAYLLLALLIVFFQPFLLFVSILSESLYLLTRLFNPLTFIVICGKIKSYFIFSILFVFPLSYLILEKSFLLFHFFLNWL